jgi:hypothetical protein
VIALVRQCGHLQECACAVADWLRPPVVGVVPSRALRKYSCDQIRPVEPAEIQIEV